MEDTQAHHAVYSSLLLRTVSFIFHLTESTHFVCIVALLRTENRILPVVSPAVAEISAWIICQIR